MSIKAYSVIALGALFCLFSLNAEAQGPSSASSPLSAKQARKQERKEARAKNRAEVKQLQQNGFDPTAAEAGYPQNIQGAERKIQASGPSAASASKK